MSHENAEDIIGGLSEKMTAVLEHAVARLQDAPPHRFFPNGIETISIGVTFGAASATLNISGEPAPPKSILRLEGDCGTGHILSLARPMLVYAPAGGTKKTLTISVDDAKSEAQRTLTLHQNRWDHFDVSLDGATPKGYKMGLRAPANAATMPKDNVWIYITSRDTGTGSETITGISDAITEDQWLQLDFTSGLIVTQSPTQP
jgi:hypothetical protein